MKNKKLLWSCLTFIIPFGMSIYFYNDLPDTIATHFNAQNVADGFMDKPLALFGLPAFMFFMHLLVIFVLNKDPKRKNMPSIMMDLMYVFLPLLTVFLMGITIGYSLGIEINIGFFTSMLIGIIFIAIGNYMPRVKQNYSMGIKTPWTLNNEEVWNKTHRLGGLCFVLMGIGTIIAGLFLNFMIIIFIIIPLAFIPMVYSYFLYQKIEKKK